MDKKPRADSKLDSMPESRVMELRDSMLAGSSYQDLLSWLAVECGVSSTPSALSAFYKRHCWPVVKERRQLSVIKSDAVWDAMQKDPVKWDAVIADKVRQRTFEFLDAPQDAAPKDIALLLDSIVSARKQEFSEEKQEFNKVIQTKKLENEGRKLSMLEAKAKRLDDAQNAIAGIQGNTDLTPEEQRAAVLDKMDEFFGLKKKV